MSGRANQTPEEREWHTLKRRIDPKLKPLGGQVVPFHHVLSLPSLTQHAVTELPTDRVPPVKALVLRERIVGTIEAEKLSLGPQNVLTEAERDARGLPLSNFNFRRLRAPFLESTTHTPLALGEMIRRDFDAECAQLAARQTAPRSAHLPRKRSMTRSSAP